MVRRGEKYKEGYIYMNKKSIEDIAVEGKKVLLRCDFNVPLDENLKITDETRLTASLPTIRYLMKKGSKVILCSHLGRPKGEFNEKYSLKPVAKRLSELLGTDVKMSKDVIGQDAVTLSASLKNGEVMLLENVRFHKEEEKNDPEFAKKLASLAEVYVNDAFGTAHRAHASTEGVAKYLPAVCGFLIQKEIKIMGEALNNPERPFVAILGGSKVSDKIGVIQNLLSKVDTILIGGGMAYTFLKSEGYNVGTSLCEDDKLHLAKELIESAKQKKVQFLLPIDIVCAEKFEADAQPMTFDADKIPAGVMGMGIGDKTAKLFGDIIKDAKTGIWNGPMSVFEFENFAAGTKMVDAAVAACKGTTIIGVGDSAAAVEQLGYADQMTHISTGGGASLEFLEGIELPGIACLLDK